MPTVFLVHGAYGNPEENWFPWLKSELEKLGCEVLVPVFPTPENQALENWLKVFEEYKPKLSEDSIVVAHSLGPAFLLTVLEQFPHPVRACFFVSPFLGKIGDPAFDTINKTFWEKEFNWEKIKQNCKEFRIFHSDNDPSVPLKMAEEVAEKLGTEVILIKGAGHFGKAAGYAEFPFLLEKIKKLL